METKKWIGLIIILIWSDLAFAGDCSEAPTWSWECTLGEIDYTYTIVGMWSTQQLALTAAQGEDGSNTWVSLNSQNCYAATGGASYGCYRKPWVGDYEYRYFCGCTQAECSICPEDGYYYPDEDGDGIPDEFDPYPNDDSELAWEPDIIYRDPDTGEIEGMLAGFEDGHKELVGTEDFMEDVDNGNLGDYDEQLQIWSESYGHDSQDWLDFIDDLSGSEIAGASTYDDYAEQSANSGGSFNQVDISDDYTEGSGDSGGSETDNQALQAIKTNTSRIAGNQEGQSTDLRRIAEATEKMAQNQILGHQDVNVDVDLDTPTAAQIASAIDSEIDGNTSAENTSVESTESSEESSLNALDFETEIGSDDEYLESEVEDKKDMETELDSINSDDDIADLIDGMDLELTEPVCKIDVEMTILGKPTTIEIGICEWEDELNDFGTILLSVVTLGSIIMIVRG